MIVQIRPRDLFRWLARQPASAAPLLLDVREPWETAQASIRPDGMAVLTMPMHTLPARLSELDRQRPVVCLCHHGGRSMQVAAFLYQHGFSQVANLAGGIDAWSQEVDAMVARY